MNPKQEYLELYSIARFLSKSDDYTLRDYWDKTRNYPLEIRQAIEDTMNNRHINALDKYQWSSESRFSKFLHLRDLLAQQNPTLFKYLYPIPF